MNARISGKRWSERGVGLVEVMVSVVIGMLMVLVIYQVYGINEAQKRTITSGSDAQENASYGLFLLSQDVSVAGNGIASSAAALNQCALLRPIPVLINAGATATTPDTITVLYGGSGSLSTPVAFQTNATSADPAGYQVKSPVGFSANDVIAAVQGANCTVSTINLVSLPNANGIVTLTHTPVTGPVGFQYQFPNAALINLGLAASLGQVVYSVDPTCSSDATKCALRTQNLISTTGAVNPVIPVISDVVNLKAQYGLDTANDGIVDKWQDATGNWSAANLPLQPLATWQQIRAVRIAIVTRSAQYETDPVTPGPILMFHDPITPDPLEVSMTLVGDQQHYRYKEIETIVPLRNAMWNSPPP